MHFVLVNAFSNNLSTVRIQRLQKKSISVIQKKSVVNDNDDNEKKRQTGAFNLIIIFGRWFYRSVFVNKKKCTIKKINISNGMPEGTKGKECMKKKAKVMVLWKAINGSKKE